MAGAVAAAKENLMRNEPAGVGSGLQNRLVGFDSLIALHFMTLKQEYIKSRNFIFSKMIFSTCMENTYGRKIYFDECNRYIALLKLIMQMQSPNKF